jgi:hypothetical protein
MPRIAVSVPVIEPPESRTGNVVIYGDLEIHGKVIYK